MKGNEKVVGRLLGVKFVAVNVRSEDLNTPLHYFCKNYSSPSTPSLFAQFLEKGADLNAANKNKETALHYAVWKRNKQMVQSLCSHHADVNLRNIEGDSPFMWMVRFGLKDLVLFSLPLADLSFTTLQGTFHSQYKYFYDLFH